MAESTLTVVCGAPCVAQVLLVLSVVVSSADFLSDLVVLYEFAMDGETLLFTASVAFVVVVAVYTGALLWGSERRVSACLQVRGVPCMHSSRGTRVCVGC